MWDLLKTIAKQPYSIVALLLGGALLILSCLTFDKDGRFAVHAPNTLWLLVPGILLISLSTVAFWLLLPSRHGSSSDDFGGGLDLSRVKEADGILSTTVSGCEIRVADGRVEDYAQSSDIATVLPCNEYFDDKCVSDTRSALGAYVSRVFDGQCQEFVSLMQGECRKKLGPGTRKQKTVDEQAESFGAGQCVLLVKPLGKNVSVALVSTTTQQAGQGLAARISYLFDGMRELVASLADARIDEVVMPVLGAGHGHIDPPLALVGLLLAVAEASRYGQGGQRLTRVTVVVFKKDAESSPEVERTVARRALALVGS